MTRWYKQLMMILINVATVLQIVVQLVKWCGMYATGVYTAESVADCSWLCMSLGLVFVYHFFILQGLGLVHSLTHCLFISLFLSL